MSTKNTHARIHVSTKKEKEGGKEGKKKIKRKERNP